MTSRAAGWGSAIRRLHRWLALLLVLPLVVVALSGAGLSFAREIDRVLSPHLWTVPPGADTSISSGEAAGRVDMLLERFQRHWPEHEVIRLDPPATARDAALAVARSTDGRARQLFLDPQRDRVLGSRDEASDPVVWLGRLHGTLMLGEAGRWVVLSASVGLLIMIGSGWVGRRRAPGGGGIRWHVTIGMWGSGIWLLMAATGLFGVNPPMSSGGQMSSSGSVYCGESQLVSLDLRSPAVATCLSAGAIGPMERQYRLASGERMPARPTDWSEALHTGRVVGVGGRMVWMWAGLALVVTAVIGLVSWSRRRVRQPGFNGWDE
ncbi:MAG: PepSY-associated TM helix domain-containing protein [Guyparkeria sp.]